MNHIALDKDPKTNNTVCKEQTSQKISPWLVPLLPNFRENLQILKEFHFKYSSFLDSEYIQLCKIPIDNMRSFTPHRNKVGEN